MVEQAGHAQDGSAQSPGVTPADDAARLAQLVGNWQGTLTYIDFQSHEPVSLPATWSVAEAALPGYLILDQTFSDPTYDVQSFIVAWVGEGGSMHQTEFEAGTPVSEEWLIVQRQLKGAAGWTYILERDGMDRGQACRLRRTLSYSGDGFQSTLQRRPAGSDEAPWSLGHELVLARQKPLEQALVGTWSVDLRPTPDAQPYTTELVISAVADGVLEGTFYSSPIEAGRTNAVWGELHFAFQTQDGAGSYNTQGRLTDGQLRGTTHSLGRSFLSVWSAQR